MVPVSFSRLEQAGNVPGRRCRLCLRFAASLTPCTSGFVYHYDYDMLKQKFYSKDAPLPRQNTILSAHGVRFAALDWLPGWLPSRKTALDWMHCIFLGILTRLHRDLLANSADRRCFISFCQSSLCRSYVLWCGWCVVLKATLREYHQLYPVAVTCHPFT